MKGLVNGEKGEGGEKSRGCRERRGADGDIRE